MGEKNIQIGVINFLAFGKTTRKNGTQFFGECIFDKLYLMFFSSKLSRGEINVANFKAPCKWCKFRQVQKGYSSIEFFFKSDTQARQHQRDVTAHAAQKQ